MNDFIVYEPKRMIYYAQGPCRAVEFHYETERIKELVDTGFNKIDIKIHDFMVRIFGDDFPIMDNYYGNVGQVFMELMKRHAI